MMTMRQIHALAVKWHAEILEQLEADAVADYLDQQEKILTCEANFFTV